MTELLLEPLSREMQECIQACLDCYEACARTEARCLEKGGKHAEARHVRLLRDCADICRVSADWMLRGSENHVLACEVCAQVCLDCAEDCERFPEDAQMRECAEHCRGCADACAKMTEEVEA